MHRTPKRDTAFLEVIPVCFMRKDRLEGYSRRIPRTRRWFGSTVLHQRRRNEGPIIAEVAKQYSEVVR